MNKTETLTTISVEQAFIEGATIQRRARGSNHSWITTHDPSWNWADNEYRVEPEPREFWLNCYPGDWACHPTKEAADKAASNRRIDCIHVREVIDE